MNVVDVIRQTMRRAGGGHARRRDAEWFGRVTNDWRAVERPERVVRRMEQLGLRQEALALAASLLSGAPLNGFNPLERIIGQNQLMSSFFLPLGAERARAVGRIVTKNGGGFGTGFLISPRLLMTNRHVLKHERAADHNRVEFDYVRRFDGSLGRTQIFRLRPAEFFITSEARGDLNLDYAIVAVEAANSQGERLAERGFIPLAAASGGLVVGELTNIIQHPGGEPQQVALRDSKVVKALDHFIHYEADTLPGSSGSPVFNDQWQLAALHHSGVPEEVRPGVYRLRDGGEWDPRSPVDPVRQLQMTGRINWISNEGVRISSIVADVRARLRNDSARLALFEDAVRAESSPPREPDEAGPQPEIGQADAAPSMGGIVTRVAGGAVTWDIPLRVTVQIGPDLHLSLSGASPPDRLSPPPPDAPTPPPHSASGDAPRPPLETPDPTAAVARAREMFETHPEVLEVRDGFLWRDGFMTERRAAVVVIDPGGAASGDPYEAQGIPREIEGLPVDVTLGGPCALLRAAARRGRPTAGASPPAELFQERVPRITYRKPEGLSLDEVTEPMEVICHASPDDGWPVLSDFLGRVEKSLTLGIQHLSAPHVVSKLRELAGRNPVFRLNLCTQRWPPGGSQGVKENDLQEAKVIEGLRDLMGDRLRQAYANVSGDERTFASAYHIKAAVRDGEELWLSSGDLQSSNQPPPDVRPAADYELSFAPLRRYNREWHVVIRNRKLARTFEAYLLHDLKTAEENPAGPPVPAPELFVTAPRTAPEADSLTEAARPRYFARKVIPEDAGAPVAVRPLLTPDACRGHVIELIRSARSRLFIQNQSPTPRDPQASDEAAFNELWQTIKSRQDAGVDVRMIFRVRSDEDDARAVKDRLVKFGFMPGRIRFQEGCHAKGVVVDSQVVMVGSHNWSNQRVPANRDASLIFRHPEIASYFEQIFLFDWDRLTREPQPLSADLIGKGGPRERIELARPGLLRPADAARLTLQDLLDD